MISWFCCIFKRKRVKIGKKTTSFDFILSTAVEGCSYAEGAQGDSDAVSLWIYARGGVQFSNTLPSPPELTEQSRGYA